jgi:hypothetical protein
MAADIDLAFDGDRQQNAREVDDAHFWVDEYWHLIVATAAVVTRTRTHFLDPSRLSRSQVNDPEIRLIEDELTGFRRRFDWWEARRSALEAG